MFDWLRKQELAGSEQFPNRDAHGAQPDCQAASPGQARSTDEPPPVNPESGPIHVEPQTDESDVTAAPPGPADCDTGADGVDALHDHLQGSPPPSSPEATGISQDGSDTDGSWSPKSWTPLATPRRGRRLVKQDEHKRAPLTGEQRLWVLDAWKRSGLPAGDFAALIGLSKHTLYGWRKQFIEHGPAGLVEQKRGVREGSRLPELTKRTILLLKEAHPEWGCERISAMLLRGPALPASPSAVARVLHEAGYQLEEVATRPHPDRVRHFERAHPNQLWQTDLFTFVMKRQNRRVYLVGFLDDHSRFLVSYGLHASQSTALVLEVLRAGITSYGAPSEILTDNGAQYVTWRGKSLFTKELEKRGIRQIVSAPRRPQTLGKIERFWGTLWRECLETAVFLDMADAQRRIGHFIDYYNFQRVHRGIGGLVPADRYFGAASEVLRTLKERVASNAIELARHGVSKPPFYMTGQVAGQSFSVHAEGDRVILRRDGSTRQEVELVGPEQSKAAGTPPLPTVETSSEPAATGLPLPLCPHGSPLDSIVDAEQPVAPGETLLDGSLDPAHPTSKPSDRCEGGKDAPPGGEA